MRPTSLILILGGSSLGSYYNRAALPKKTLTHTQAGATTDDRKWTIVWDAPAEGGIGAIHFWITGNSVDGLNGNGS